MSHQLIEDHKRRWQAALAMAMQGKLVVFVCCNHWCRQYEFIHMGHMVRDLVGFTGWTHVKESEWMFDGRGRVKFITDDPRARYTEELFRGYHPDAVYHV